MTGEVGGLDGPRPAFLGRRVRHLASSTSTIVDATNGVGGLALRFDDRSYVALEARGDGTHNGHGAGGAVRSAPSLDGRTAGG